MSSHPVYGWHSSQVRRWIDAATWAHRALTSDRERIRTGPEAAAYNSELLSGTKNHSSRLLSTKLCRRYSGPIYLKGPCLMKGQLSQWGTNISSMMTERCREKRRSCSSEALRSHGPRGPGYCSSTRQTPRGSRKTVWHSFSPTSPSLAAQPQCNKHEHLKMHI